MASVRPFRPDERGIALLLVLLVLVLLLVLITQLALSARVDLQVAVNERKTLRLEYALRGALEVGRYLLRLDLEENQHDGLQDKWARPRAYVPLDFGEGLRVVLDIVDESRKFNLYWLATGRPRERRTAQDRLTRILDVMREKTKYDLPPYEAEELAARIARYVRARREGKRRKFDDRILAPSRHGVLLSLEEIRPLVGDFLFYDQETDDGEKLPGLERFVTLWSDGRVNVNTAPPTVLRAFFPDRDLWKIERLVELRRKLAEEAARLPAPPPAPVPVGPGGPGGPAGPERFVGVKTLEELVRAGILTQKERADLSPFLGTASQCFSLFATARQGTLLRRRRLLVRRDQGRLFTLLTQERTDRRVHLGEGPDPLTDEERAAALDPSRLLHPR